MSDEEKKLSAYMTLQSVNSRNFSLFAGFTFTAITILLTRLPDTSTWQSQAMLFFLTVLFSQLIYHLAVNEAVLTCCVKFAPKLPEKYTKNSLRERMLIWLLLDAAVLLLFLFYNLLYLALATGILFVLTTARTLRTLRMILQMLKPFQRIDLYESGD